MATSYRSIATAALLVALLGAETAEEIARRNLATQMSVMSASGQGYPTEAPSDFPYATIEQLHSLSTKFQHRLPEGDPMFGGR